MQFLKPDLLDALTDLIENQEVTMTIELCVE